MTDVYDGSASLDAGHQQLQQQFGEIGLAADSTKPLVAPTEVVDAQNHAAVDDRTAYNDAHRIILDDGSSTNYTDGHRPATAVPVDDRRPTSARVGAAVTFPRPDRS